MLVQKLPNTKRQINNWFEFFELNATKASCRVKRHLPTTRSRQLGSPAEIRPATAIHTHHPNTREAKPNSGPKLYSKVLAIEPNRLLSKCRWLIKGDWLRLCLRSQNQEMGVSRAQIWWGDCSRFFSLTRKISKAKTPLAMSHMETWMAFWEMA